MSSLGKNLHSLQSPAEMNTGASKTAATFIPFHTNINSGDYYNNGLFVNLPSHRQFHMYG